MRPLRGGYPRRGELWFGELDPTVGHEQAGDRPLLVLSADRYNALSREMLIVVPLTTTLRGDPFEVIVEPPAGNLTRRSAILCDQPRSISRARLRRRLGSLDAAVVAAAVAQIRLLIPD